MPLSDVMDATKVEEMFVANDDCFVLAVNSVEAGGRKRDFSSTAVAEGIRKQLRDIHVSATQTGKRTQTTLCTDQYTEETWSHPL